MFIGQTRVVSELNLILNECTNGRNFNILLSAPSGFGKTTLALKFLNTVGLGRSYIAEPPDYLLNLSRRFIFLDEIHLYPQPEDFYHLLDSGEYTFILATNETGLLKEPLINRCIVLEFTEYTDEEATRIITGFMGTLPQEIVDVIIRVTSKIPRHMKILCTRLDYVFRTYGVPTSSDQFLQMLSSILNIDENGYSPIQRRYIDYLTAIGGQGSIDTISNGLRLSKTTLLREVEPRLLYDKLITISHKGRALND